VLKAAIECYNILAVEHKPVPVPLITYAEVIDYCSIDKFELLINSDRDLTQKPWTIQSNRQATNKYFKLIQANEEL
jgi:hypothetical protein